MTNRIKIQEVAICSRLFEEVAVQFKHENFVETGNVTPLVVYNKYTTAVVLAGVLINSLVTLFSFLSDFLEM